MTRLKDALLVARGAQIILVFFSSCNWCKWWPSCLPQNQCTQENQVYRLNEEAVDKKKKKIIENLFFFLDSVSSITHIYWISQDHGRKQQSWIFSTSSFSAASRSVCATAIKSHRSPNSPHQSLLKAVSSVLFLFLDCFCFFMTNIQR